jgi:hypothetical protein
LWFGNIKKASHTKGNIWTRSCEVEWGTNRISFVYVLLYGHTSTYANLTSYTHKIKYWPWRIRPNIVHSALLFGLKYPRWQQCLTAI